MGPCVSGGVKEEREGWRDPCGAGGVIGGEMWQVRKMGWGTRSRCVKGR